jgi:translation initiation factor 1A
MPKREKSMKNSVRNKAVGDKRQLLEKDEDGTQVYGIATKALGSAFFIVNCFDGKERRCKARQKRMKVAVGNVIIVSLRDYSEDTADIIYVYDHDEARQLQKLGCIPNTSSDLCVNASDKINISGEPLTEAFDFADL